MFLCIVWFTWSLVRKLPAMLSSVALQEELLCARLLLCRFSGLLDSSRLESRTETGESWLFERRGLSGVFRLFVVSRLVRARCFSQQRRLVRCRHGNSQCMQSLHGRAHTRKQGQKLGASARAHLYPFMASSHVRCDADIRAWRGTSSRTSPGVNERGIDCRECLGSRCAELRALPCKA